MSTQLALMDKEAAEKRAELLKECSELDQVFSKLLETKQGQEEVRERSLLYIKQILREESFARKILPPESVTKYDLQRAVDNDTVQKVVDIEPNSLALPLNFRSEPTGDYVEGPRYAIDFFTISSELFEKTEQELFAYESPLIQIIEENSVKDIQEIEDSQFIGSIDTAVAATGKSLDLAAKPRLDKDMLTDAFKLIDSDRLNTEVILMANTTFNDVLNLDLNTLGDTVASKVIVDGYTYNQLLGKRLIVTTKTNIIATGVVYLFTDQKYLGNFFILNSTKFYIDKVADLIRWKTWEVIGIGIGNINSAARLRFGAAAP